MPYVPTGTWVDLPLTTSPIVASRLNQIEAGIVAAQAAAEAAQAAAGSSASVTALQATVTTLQAQVTSLQAVTAAGLLVWNTRVGGALTGAVTTDGTGSYPPHPVTQQLLLFNNPLVMPSFDGDRVAGTGGMAPGDFWFAGGTGVATV